METTHQKLQRILRELDEAKAQRKAEARVNINAWGFVLLSEQIRGASYARPL